MYDDIIFMYELMTVWGTICETVVSETDSGVVISFTDEKKQKEISADTDVVERIKNIIAEHEVIFTYDELECPDFFEGRYQEFIFSSGDKKKRLTALNIGRVKNPDAVFYIQKTSETVNRPEKAIEVVKLLDEISKVLIEYGVDESCLRLL